MEALGIPAENLILKVNVTEDESAYDACVDLAEQGCDIIITDSYGHQDFTSEAAAEYPDITFVAMTGDKAWYSGLSNLKNAFCHTYESRYVSGVVAGMKLAEMVENGELTDKNYDENGNIKLGYVGAYPYAEVVSGYTAFFLGVQSIVENVVMDVSFTNSWYDPIAEAAAAEALVANGACIISQHADSTGAPSAIEALREAGEDVYCVGYNISMLSVAPTAALTSATNDWSVFYTYALTCMLNGEELATDWSEGYATGANAITELGESCAPGTAEKVAEVEAAIADGSLNVFDCSTFTVDGEHPTSFLALDTDGDWVGDTGEAIVDGIFYESNTDLRSAPYFALNIDGITQLN
jgi:basic membrane protein A